MPYELTPQTALIFVDDQLHAAQGHRLNDLERAVFMGSWEGKTYEEIYPSNPQYVEKSVGYKLWQKLSEVFSEKVTKKRIRGAVMRHYIDTFGIASEAIEGPAREGVYITIHHGQLDNLYQGVVRHISRCLKTSGYSVSCRIRDRPVDSSQPKPECEMLLEIKYEPHE